MGLRDLFKKQEPEVPANEKHLTFKELKAISRTDEEVWFRHADPNEPQVNSGHVVMFPDGSVDIMTTRYNDEKEPRWSGSEIRAKHVSPEDVFWSRDDLIAANEERLNADNDFAKAVESIPTEEAGQKL